MTEQPIEKIAVIGAGQMGGGIAQVAAQAGVRVVLLDADASLAQRGVERIASRLARLVEKEKITGDEREQALGRLATSAEYAALSDCQLAVEATPELEALKREILAKMDAAAAPSTILATNTSSISITKLAASTRRPEQVIGMHFMNPVPLMQLVEIVRGLATSDATHEATEALARRFGKTTITARDVPGFIVNRVLIPLLNEACYALYEGLGTAQDIDTGVELGLNHPMGPLALADLIGLDTCLSIAEVLHRELGDDKYRPCPLLRQYVAAGWLGRKSRRGFYRYDERGKPLERASHLSPPGPSG